MSLLSIPLFVNSSIADLFITGKAVFIDLQEDFLILVYRMQETDGLSYVKEYKQGVHKVK